MIPRDTVVMHRNDTVTNLSPTGLVISDEIVENESGELVTKILWWFDTPEEYEQWVYIKDLIVMG